MPTPRAALLLPPSSAFELTQLSEGLRCALSRADKLEAATPGRRAQLRRYITLVPAHWPIAALARKQDCGVEDAQLGSWLRADPVHVRPDINGARLLGWGEALQLEMDDAQALVAALRVNFGDSGVLLDAPLPHHWYLKLPKESKLPEFTDPYDALGTDLSDAIDTSPEGRRWRALVGEAQITLYNHPVNAARRARGLPIINSLWLWGGGTLPHQVEARGWALASRDPAVQVLARAAQCRAPACQAWELPTTDTAIDLHRLSAPADIPDTWMLPALSSLQRGELSSLILDFADGVRFELARQHRWRLFRPAIKTFE